MPKWSHPFRTVLDDELDRFGEDPVARNCEDPVIQRAHDARLAGLAFSGGGIRSATFNLGVLQALADLKLLRKFHYLSTVSGGGYIGSWLVAWIHRRRGRLDEVANALRTDWVAQAGGRAPEEVHFLRRFSNYLTPKLGWLGADTWTVIAIYLRNVLLNFAALIAAIAFVMMLPRVVGIVMATPLAAGPLFSFTAVALGALLALSGVAVCWNLIYLQKRQAKLWSKKRLRATESRVIQLISEKAPFALQPDESGVRLPGLQSELQDFVLELGYFEESSTARTSLFVRAEPNLEEEQLGWEIKIGENVTGNIGTQRRGAEPPPTRRGLRRLRVACVGQACSVWLDGKLLNVSRAAGAVPKSGFIGLAQERGQPLRIRRLFVYPLPASPALSRQGAIQLAIVLPLLLVGLILMRWLGQSEPISRLFGLTNWWCRALLDHEWIFWAAIFAAVTFCAHATELVVKFPAKLRKGWWEIFCSLVRATWSVFSAALAGAAGGAAFAGYNAKLSATGHFWARLIWGPPAFVVAISIFLILYVGLRGHNLRDDLREWWSRLGAWLLIYALFWIGLFGMAFYSPPALRWLAIHLPSALATLSFTWVATTVSALFVSRSEKNGKKSTSRWRPALVAIAPYVFIVGLLAGLAWGIDGTISRATPPIPVATLPGHLVSWHNLLEQHWQSLSAAHPALHGSDLSPGAKDCLLDLLHGRTPTSGNCLLFQLLVITLVVAALLGWRVDINEFSMHMMYRNRLARCYLGASNAALRRPHAFTGFDQNDDIQLADLAQAPWKDQMSGPYPIINCSLNLVGGHELAWQQRNAASFVFTPSYCGYDFSDLPPGYCRTSSDDEQRGYAASRTPLTLATAMAISGAAASPNMGYHTAPATAFLMTLFNIRLGWWIGNPRHRRGWLRSSPGWALGRLIAEMFGLTNAEGEYVYLSDGGHFENLGIFELVRRRCRFIIACDAEEDGDFEFSGLGNAIEKCRTDLGIDIEIDVESIRQRDENGHSHAHCAVGRIHYEKSDPKARPGMFLYLKSSLTGDEPTDVQRYAAREPAFPHESTMDQAFGESQFESYRALGHHAAMSAFLRIDAAEKIGPMTTERLFVNLAQRWYRPSIALDASFKRRGETLNALYETLRTNRHLAFLNEQIYSEWRELVRGRKGLPPRTPIPTPWIPGSYDELREGFYFCNRLISLMEDVYHDLHLEQEYSHPDNRGWMNLFKHWAWSRMFRTTWTVTAATCGARFQNFCVRQLDLEVGRVERTPEDLPAILDATTQPDASRLSFVEWNLIRSFFAEPAPRSLRDGAQLELLYLSPGERKEKEADPENKEPEFIVGFALFRRPIRWKEELARQILYFRVRDHVRRMGIARRGLYKFIADERAELVGPDDKRLKPLPEEKKLLLGLDLHWMPDNALQKDREILHELFEDLHRGVCIEFELRRKERELADIAVVTPAKPDPA